MAKRSKIGQALALFLFLVVLPVGSWYYLRSGYQYRKASLEELQDLGKLQTFSALTASGDTIELEDLKGNVLVAAFLPRETDGREVLIRQMDKLYRQFDARNDILFVSHYEEAYPVSMSLAAAFPLMQDTVQWVLLSLPGETYNTFATESYGIAEDNGLDTDLLTLVDTSMTVKRHYNSKNNQQMGRLIEHITIVMPRRPEKDAVFRREKEK